MCNTTFIWIYRTNQYNFLLYSFFHDIYSISIGRYLFTQKILTQSICHSYPATSYFISGFSFAIMILRSFVQLLPIQFHFLPGFRLAQLILLRQLLLRYFFENIYCLQNMHCLFYTFFPSLLPYRLYIPSLKL